MSELGMMIIWHADLFKVEHKWNSKHHFNGDMAYSELQNFWAEYEIDSVTHQVH